MDLNKYPAAHDQVAARIVDGSAVIVTADSGQVTVLNAVGTRMWQLIDGTHTVQEIASVIHSEYLVDLEQAQRDVVDLMQKLIESNTVVLRDQPLDTQ